MHLISLLFWIVFLIPGFAVVRRWNRPLLDAGILPAIALSFLASLIIMSPISILGFLIGFPVWVLSASVIAFVAWGIHDLFIRNKAGRELLDLSKGALVLESLALSVLVIASARLGSKLGADGLIHMARIRQFLDHGLTNADPFVRGDHFYGIYHTNLFHALLASCSQLTRVDHLGVWYAFLPLANILIAGGIAFLAYQIFPKVWLGWLAAIFFLVDQAAVDFMTYPNKLAPFFLIPIVIGFIIQALRDRPGVKDAIQIGAVSLVIGQFHGMYAVFICVLVGPMILFAAANRLLRKKENPTPWVLVGLAVLIGLPFPAISKMDENKTNRESKILKMERDADPNSVQTESGTRIPVTQQSAIRKKFYFFPNGWLIKDPFRGWGGGAGIFGLPGYRYQLLLLGLIAAYFSPRRREVMLGLGVLLSCAAFLYIAPLCTFLLWVVEAEWIVLRLETAGFPVLFPALAVAAFGWHLSRIITLRWGQSILVIIAIPLAIDFSGQASVKFFPLKVNWKDRGYNWKGYLEGAGKSKAIRMAEIESLRENRKFLQEVIPAGETVLVRDTRAMEVVMLHDIFILAPIRSSAGVPGLSYLRRINRMLINERSEWPIRKRLLKEYGVRFYIPQGDPKWIRGHEKVRDGKLQKFRMPNQPDWKIVEIDTED